MNAFHAFDPAAGIRAHRIRACHHPRATAWIAITTSLALCAWASRPRAAAEGPVDATGIRLRLVAQGLAHPTFLTAPPGDPRLFVVEQKGTIRIVSDGHLLPEPFLDLTDRVRDGGERGLLSMAFHPDYARNGWFYVNYTDLHGDTQVERYSVTSDPDRADPGSTHRILSVEQPYANHNGGLVVFGLDGMLYVGMGDGGAQGDPHRMGQNLRTLLGKLLRIDVDHGDPYSIPKGNPYAERSDARPEIWALGLRNPWRFCFDRATGLLYIADVGQNQWEEVDVQPADRAGLDYGWSVMEGTHCYRDPKCSKRGLVIPALEYDHAQGCSITGGYVYRGHDRALAGHYFFSDYCSGWIESFRYERGRATQWRRWRVPERMAVSSFGEDGAGDLYVLDYDGKVYEIEAATP